MQAIQLPAMTDSFPYPILSKLQLIGQINQLAALRTPFLFIIDYKAEQGYVIRQEELDDQFVLFNFQYCESNANSEELEKRNKDQGPIQWKPVPMSRKEYQPRFDYVVGQIYKGNSFLVNLTQPTEIKTNLSLFDLYRLGNAKYKLWLKDRFVVFSPETFVRIEGRTVSSFPMKGTIDAAIPNAEEIILNDPKEMAEHATIVDLIRNDLSLVADQVQVKRYRYIDKIITNKQNLLQVSSEILGVLPADYQERLGDILFALLPAGSICGAPKRKTLEVIEQAEGYERGFYAGICGYYDGENLDAGVMIRYVEQEGERLIFKSGGGITAQSDLEKEYEELIQKVYVPVC